MKTPTIYVLELRRWNAEYDEEVKFTALKEARRALAEVNRSEGRTLAFVHRCVNGEKMTIASRDWYTAPIWKMLKPELYCAVINILRQCPAYNRAA